VTEYELRVTQELNSVSRAAWAIAWLIALGLILSSWVSVSSSETYEGEELDTQYAQEKAA
jgi:hypothetical protein